LAKCSFRLDRSLTWDAWKLVNTDGKDAESLIRHRYFRGEFVIGFVSRAPAVVSGLILVFLLGSMSAGCRKAITPEEQEELLRKCHRLSEEFAEDVADAQKALLPRLARINEAELVSRLKRAAKKAGEANQELVLALQQAQGDRLMSAAQSENLRKTLGNVTKAQQTLRDIMAEARRSLVEKLKRRRKPS
jgi:hypothetical protein